MNDIIDMLSEDITVYNTALMIVLSLLCYLWKHYEKIIQNALKQSDKNSTILNEIHEIINNSKFVENEIKENIEELNKKIDELDSRFTDLEKTLIEMNITDKEILKDIENTRKVLEVLQIVKTLINK